jgi:hypothetical protein
MNATEFKSLLTIPAEQDTTAPELLKTIIGEYPWCQTAHLLYARRLQALQHIAFGSQLRLAAAYAGNRGILRKLLAGDQMPADSMVEEQSFQEITSETPVIQMAHEQSEQQLPEAEPAQAEEAQKTALSKKEIIERFISVEPHISRPQKGFFNPADHARQSVIDNETIVSETLAKLLVKQGHVAKAVKVYEKLRLVFPEKSLYFAGLIEKLKQESN